MKKRLPMLAVVTALLVGVSGTAYAFDCIRVSSSAKGLAASTRSGNWITFSFGTAAELKATFADDFELPLTDEQAACIQEAYAATGQPLYVALGVGVAGGKKTSVPSNGARGDNLGILAWNNKNDGVLSNSRGIDHFEDGVLPALIGAAIDCGVDPGA